MLHLLHIFVLVFSSITLHFSLLPCLQAICTSQVVSRRSWSPEEEKTLPLSPSRSRYSTPANSSATASSSVTASATSPLWCPSDVMWGERYLASLSVLPPSLFPLISLLPLQPRFLSPFVNHCYHFFPLSPPLFWIVVNTLENVDARYELNLVLKLDRLASSSYLFHLVPVSLSPYQLSPEAEPLDQLDALALSVLQEIGSTATTGIHSHTVEICSSRDMNILFTIICII